MSQKEQKEGFRLDHYGLKKDSAGERLCSPVPVIVTLLQAVILSFIISSINVNTLLPWYTNQHITRTFLICSASILLVGQRILNRQHALTLKNNLIMEFTSHILFTYCFIQPQTLLKFDRTYIFPLSKLKIHVNLLFSVVNSAIFSSFFTFLDCFVKSRIVYTQAPGLFAYLRSKLVAILVDAKNVMQWCIRLSVVGFILYFCLFHNILSILTFSLRISLFYNSITEVVFHILILCINDAVFYIFYAILEYVAVFNLSFNSYSVDYHTEPDDNAINDIKSTHENVSNTDCINSILLKYHKAVMAFKSKELKFKTKPNEAKLVEIAACSALDEIREILKLFEASRNSLDSEIFVTVPQANKRYIKRYRAYHLLNILWGKMQYQAQCFVLSRRLSIVLDSLIEILDFVFTVREQEGIQLLNQAFFNDLLETVEHIGDISGKLQIDLKDERLSNLINKLQ
ncbi:uncharacterized protein VICG_01772 [Vittaforma corneae ATCC 50505]|uniref:Uncharacterized protein n=1 Tax=Vittaforma corneae (strain ATCC 50505) TaxID=993615 RepID=L2GJX1_VITCO|nr:uncharacterized protein VICG_01772 [Vittaforma corneae ATCC 50505]ELA41173.1 hypothetical protein VICG_01772 [Vittaforma corneae ATCC 50505]